MPFPKTKVHNSPKSSFSPSSVCASFLGESLTTFNIKKIHIQNHENTSNHLVLIGNMLPTFSIVLDMNSCVTNVIALLEGL